MCYAEPRRITINVENATNEANTVKIVSLIRMTDRECCIALQVLDSPYRFNIHRKIEKGNFWYLHMRKPRTNICPEIIHCVTYTRTENRMTFPGLRVSIQHVSYSSKEKFQLIYDIGHTD